MTLSQWLTNAVVLVDSGTLTAARFVELRYDEMNKLFPHNTFSVNEATPDFFATTLGYLSGEQSIPTYRPGKDTIKDDPYWVAYRDWMKMHIKAEAVN